MKKRSNGVVVVNGGGDDDDREWVVYIKEQLEAAKHRQEAATPSIFMAASPLRGVKLEAFIPQVVSIGPFHSDLGPHHSSFPDTQETERYKSVAAREMEQHKLVSAYLLARFHFPNADISALAGRLLPISALIRSSYDTNLAFCGTQSDDKLSYMMAIDASFVLEVLRCSAADSAAAAEFLAHPLSHPLAQAVYRDYFCSRFPRPLRKSILQDFVLLENQLPLSVLIHAMTIDARCRPWQQQPAKGASEEDEDLAASVLGALAQAFAGEVLPFPHIPASLVRRTMRNVRKRSHLLDCLYAIVTTGEGDQEAALPPELKPTHLPSATELDNSGVKLSVAPRESAGNMSAIRYDKKRSTLYVPFVRVGDDTERLFRNLIAYESHLIDEVSVLSYLRFMNGLVDTAEDVALLVQKGVLAQDIGSNQDVAAMWNGLCVNTMRVCSGEHEAIALQLVAHCRSRANVLKAEFKRTYLSRPWLIVSLLSGAALLLMTLIIMYYTIRLYTKPGA